VADQKQSKTDFLAKATKRLVEDNIISTKTLLEGGVPEIQFLVPGCIPKACIVLLTGDSGAGKSWIAYDLALAVSNGSKWLGRGASVEEPKTVLILNYDNPTDILRIRISKMGVDPERNVFYHTQGSVLKMLRLPQEGVSLKMIIDQLQPSLTIVDSLRQGHTYDENNNQDMSNLMNIFKTWTTIESKNTVLILHHTAKKNSSSWAASARGSGEIIASSDVVIETSVDGGHKMLKWTKVRPWDIGDSTPECSFEIKDRHVVLPNNRVKVSTSVKATSDLPGEKEYLSEREILTFLAKNGRATRNEIYDATKPMIKSIIDTSLRRLEAKNIIKYVHTNKGRFYELCSDEDSSADE
jgi:archaellum biogenesis ATPase FlaH